MSFYQLDKFIAKIQESEDFGIYEEKKECQCQNLNPVSTYHQECVDCGKITEIQDSISLEDRKLTGYLRINLTGADKKIQQFLSWEMYKQRIQDILINNKQILSVAKKPELPQYIIDQSLEELQEVWLHVKMKGKTPDRVLVSLIIQNCTKNQLPVNTKQMIKLFGIQDEKISQGTRFIREYQIYKSILQDIDKKQIIQQEETPISLSTSLNSFNINFRVRKDEENLVIQLDKFIQEQLLFPELIQITKCMIVASLFIFQRLVNQECVLGHKKNKNFTEFCKKCLIAQLKPINSDIRKLKKYSTQILAVNIPEFETLNLLLFK